MYGLEFNFLFKEKGGKPFLPYFAYLHGPVACEEN